MGSIRAARWPSAGRPADGDDKQETEEQKQQHERTNRSNLDDYRAEGNVVGIRCTLDTPILTLAQGFIAQPDAVPYALIAMRDGARQVVLQHDARAQCASNSVGDYLEAEGERVHEALFLADDVTIKRGGRRVR